MTEEEHLLADLKDTCAVDVVEKGGYILGIDFGSTALNIKIYDTKGTVIADSAAKIPYLDLPKSAVEIDPNELFDLFVRNVKDLLAKNNIHASEIRTSGFTFQKGTFLLWNKEDGEPRCNLISWQDTRCADVVKELNDGYLVKAINIIGSISYALTRQAKFLAMKVLNFDTVHSSARLLWLLNNDAQLYEDMRKKEVLFGTLDTWIIWKLSKGREFVTDYSCASGTALFDPYTCQWSSIVSLVLGLPFEVFPKVLNTSGDIAYTEEDIFGVRIPVNAIVADCQAGAFALNCYKTGEFSFIIGTGCFIDINTGLYCHASIAGLYPQIGWKIGEELTYVCEGQISDIASSIEWGKQIGLFDDVAVMSDIAYSVEDTDGVFYVPAFHGLSAPHLDRSACAIFIGIKTTTTKAHMVRAILEGIAFRFVELYYVAMDETKVSFQPPIKISGGVSNNDFLMQMVSSLMQCVVEKSKDSNVSISGAVYLAGLGAGIWKDLEEIRSIPKSNVTYNPDPDVYEKYVGIKKQWLKAVERCMHWNT